MKSEASPYHRSDKLATTFDKAGFFPHGYEEMNSAATLLEDRYALGGAAKYVSELSLHNKKYEQAQLGDPVDLGSYRVYRSITQDFIDYRLNASTAVRVLLDMRDRLARDPSLIEGYPFKDSRIRQEIWEDGFAKDSLIALLKAGDTGKLFMFGGEDRLGEAYDTDDALNRAFDNVASEALVPLQRRLSAVRAIEESRFDFWNAQIFGEKTETQRRLGLIALNHPGVQLTLRKAFPDINQGEENKIAPRQTAF